MVEIIRELNDNNIKKIVRIIDDGGIVSFPTETVYALVADATNFEAVEKIYQIKRRFNDKPLPVLVGDIYQAKRVAEFDERAKKLAFLFFPGPITLVLNSKSQTSLAKNINGNLGTVGIRMPNNVSAIQILKAVGRPLVGTSANISNQESAITGDEVFKTFEGQIELLLDTGSTDIGTPSTIVDLTGEKVKILREGAIARAVIEDILGEKTI